ncbi:hypothetical protein ACFL1U_00240 [Patescibacteria group bacterium]
MANNHKLQEEIERQADKRARKRKPKMKVSGKEVFKLQNIIRQDKKTSKK